MLIRGNARAGKPWIALCALIVGIGTTGTVHATPAAPRTKTAHERAVALTERSSTFSVRTTPDGRTTSPSMSQRDTVVRDSFKTKQDTHDPQKYEAVVRALLTSQWNQKVISLRDLFAQHAAADVADGSVDRIGIPAGDLTGDGADDILSFEVGFDNNTGDITSAAAVALDGPTGAPIWNVAINYYDTLVLFPGDLNGDGADDLLVDTIHATNNGLGECAILACADVIAATLSTVVAEISGRTGLPVWERTTDENVVGAELLGSALVGFTIDIAEVGTASMGIPIPADDQNGDGARDVVFNTFDFIVVETINLALVADSVAVVVLSATRSELNSGKDGHALFTRSQQMHPGIATLVPAGQAVGSSTGDLLWDDDEFLLPDAFACVFVVVGGCVSVGTGIDSLEMLDGATDATAWSKQIEDPAIQYAYAIPAGTDLTGDGFADVLAIRYDVSSGAYVVLSGATGADAWSAPRALPDFGFLPIGPVGGAPGSDIVEAGSFFTDTAFAISLTRVDGGTGTKLFTTTPGLDISAPYLDLFIDVPGDTNSDGALDFLDFIYTYDENFNPGPTYGAVESGATGEAIWSKTGTSNSGAFGIGDVDGSGTQDIAFAYLTTHRDRFDLHLDALAMPSGAAVWHRTDVIGASQGLFVIPAGDIDDDGKGDLVVSTYSYDNAGELSRVDGVRGATGHNTWTYGDVIPELPPLPAGAITGIVTDTSAHGIGGICVSADDDEGAQYAYAETAADGTYTLAELDRGSFIVYFTDCFGSDHVAQWYDGATVREDATLVDVAVGAHVAGINATLITLHHPVNDDIDNATSIDALPFTAGGTTVGATEGYDDVACGGYQTVWFAYLPSTPGLVTVRATPAEPLPISVAVTNNLLGPPPSGGCSANQAGHASVQFQAIPGTTTYIQVSQEAGSETAFTLEALSPV